MSTSTEAFTPFTTTTHRQMVLNVVNGASSCLRGHEISTRTGLTYRQTIDTLNALHNLQQVQRTGRKFTARWSRLKPATPHPAHQLEQAFREFFK